MPVIQLQVKNSVLLTGQDVEFRRVWYMLWEDKIKNDAKRVEIKSKKNKQNRLAS